MASNLSMNSVDSDVFYVEQSSKDPSLPGPKTPIVLNSTEMSANDTREMIWISSIASPETHIVTVDSDSNEPTIPNGFPNFSPKTDQSEPSIQSIQHPGNNGGSKHCRRWLWWQLKPTTTGAFRTVTDIDAPDERQHDWRMGDSWQDDGC